MASISVTDSDFDCVAGAAMDAEANGDMEAAKALDKIARKINLALTQGAHSGLSFAMGTRTSRSWRDMPSTLGLRS